MRKLARGSSGHGHTLPKLHECVVMQVHAYVDGWVSVTPCDNMLNTLSLVKAHVRLKPSLLVSVSLMVGVKTPCGDTLVGPADCLPDDCLMRRRARLAGRVVPMCMSPCDPPGRLADPIACLEGGE